MSNSDDSVHIQKVQEIRTLNFAADAHRDVCHVSGTKRIPLYFETSSRDAR